MNFSITTNNEAGYIHYIHTGELSAEDIGQAWEVLLSLKEFTEEHYNLLSDYRNSTFNMPLGMVDMIVDFLSPLEPVLKGKKQALIVSTPFEAASSIIFAERVFSKTGFIVKTFTTEEAALNFLK